MGEKAVAFLLCKEGERQMKERGQCMGLRLKEEENGKSPSLLRVQGRRRKSQRDWGPWLLPTTAGTL
ncbi:hypothetical protein NC653_034479 [Populus alba x Populus x berolinensis]|uniref:Uncharacterized protein n=1 Tax=Populus alba x Populus x berolinensis TaxID=444605 RepID=A0AAD6LMM0_9ROSI|nr:hypothetical protein NC653_034479 [Populus alba x Populus x berolinensis]